MREVELNPTRVIHGVFWYWHASSLGADRYGTYSPFSQPNDIGVRLVRGKR